MKRRIFLALCSALACNLVACNDDSQGVIGTPENSCNCQEGQTCSAGGVCYENPDCAVCTADEMCVNGKCYAKDTPCAQCDEDQVCVSEKCYDASSPCAQCDEDQVCVGEKCYNSSSPCAKCDENQVCVGKTCYDASSPCAKCDATEVCVGEKCYLAGTACANAGCQVGQTCVGGECYDNSEPCAKCQPEQICNKDACYDPTEPCAKCTDDQVCFKNSCVHPDDSCDPECKSTEFCLGGVCTTCPVVCGDACCNENETCDQITNRCRPTCPDGSAACNGICCPSNQTCDPEFGCVLVCNEMQTSCRNSIHQMIYCCKEGTVCEDEVCKEDCKGGVRCNEVCCPVGDVCEDGVCKMPCDKETHVRCGLEDEYCCENSTEACLFNACLKRKGDCVPTDDLSCGFNEYCDPSLLSCIDASHPSVCTYVPPKATFAPTVKWHAQIKSSPIQTYFATVANLTDDNGDGIINENDVPDVVTVPASRVLHVINGEDGSVTAMSAESDFNNLNDMALGDVDKDDIVDIIIGTHTLTANSSSIRMVNLVKNASGKYELKILRTMPVKDSSTEAYFTSNYSTSSVDYGYWTDVHPAIADVDSDGNPDIVTSLGILPGVGDWSKWTCRFDPVIQRLGYWYTYLFAVADLDQDGNMEVISQDIYNNKCERIVDGRTGCSGATCNRYYAAVADILPNENKAEYPGELVPEIVRVGAGHVNVWKVYKNVDGSGKTTWSQRMIWTAKFPGSAGGGNPTIADFDGDGQRDIAVAGKTHYTVFKGHDGSILWASKTQDASSERTGSTVFDFDGDGIAEVVYRDEVKLRVYSGPGTGKDEDGDGYNDAEVLWSTDNRSGTVIEYPIVVDVDNDGKTEILMVHNGGLTAYRDTLDNWVRTRRIWNQHSYHVSNINEDGSVPQREQANWLHTKLNNYRQNVQPGGIFNAPNFKAGTLTADYLSCPAQIQLTAQIRNDGAIDMGKNMTVVFYIPEYGPNKDKVRIGEATLTESVPVSGIKTVSINWDFTGVNMKTSETIRDIELPQNIAFEVDVLPADSTEVSDYGTIHECIEDDNTSIAYEIAACPIDVN